MYFFLCKQKSSHCFPTSHPTCPDVPPLCFGASPLEAATTLSRVIRVAGAHSLTLTHWPYGDWILDKVSRQLFKLGQAASAEQTPVLWRGCVNHTPRGEASVWKVCEPWKMPLMAWNDLAPFFQSPS